MAMWNPLRRFFADQPADGAAPSAPAPGPVRAASAVAPAAAAAPTARPLPPAATTGAWTDTSLDRRFTAMLVSCEAVQEQALTPAERDILERLTALESAEIGPDIVPRLPAVLPRLIGLTRRADTSPRELAALLARDPALVGEVMRLANSPYYRASREIADLQDAVLVLGQTGLSQLVTRVAMRPIFSLAQGRFGRHAGERLWQWSELCARASAALRHGQADQFQAYLAGTVVPIGLMAALRVMDQHYASAAAPASEAFHAALWRQAAVLSAHAARQWQFPDEVTKALLQRATKEPADGADPLDSTVQGADRAARRHLMAIEIEGEMTEPEVLACALLRDDARVAQPA